MGILTWGRIEKSLPDGFPGVPGGVRESFPSRKVGWVTGECYLDGFR